MSTFHLRESSQCAYACVDFVAIKWASRWDQYLKSSQSNVHWFSIVNSVIIVIFLAGMIGVILVRTLHRDITRYNQV